MILIDRDVLIDVALDRQPFSGAASELLDRLRTGPKRAFVAWHTLSNFYYLVTPARGGSDVRAFIGELIRFVVTRNVRDFRASPIPAITPANALETLF